MGGVSMTDLISRSELIKTLDECVDTVEKQENKSLLFAFGEFIMSAPAVDAVPVVHARWIYSGDMDLDGNSQGYCSRCGAGDKHRADLKNLVPYCWKCGARMDAEGDR